MNRILSAVRTLNSPVFFRVALIALIVFACVLSTTNLRAQETPQPTAPANNGVAQSPSQQQQQQSQASSAPQSVAARLYAEADGFVDKKFQEYRTKGIGYSKALHESSLREQRELAARNAAQLASTAETLAPADFYYVAALYQLAMKEPEALQFYQRFLKEAANASAEQKQTARANVITLAANKDLLEEAEAALAAYKNAQPQKLVEQFRFYAPLAQANRRAKRYERAIELANESIKIAREQPAASVEDRAARDDSLSAVTDFIVAVYMETNRKPEAVRALEALRLMSLALPSSVLYAETSKQLTTLGARVDPLKSLSVINNAAGAPSVAPEIAAKEWIGQKPTTLSDMRGRVVLLDFWATWCSPCIRAFPTLASWHRKYNRRGLTVLGVTQYYGAAGAKNQNATPAQELAYLRIFKRQQRVPYGFAINDSSENMARYGVQPIPTVILIDKKGRVRHMTVGGGDRAEDLEMERLIQKLLAEPA